MSFSLSNKPITQGVSLVTTVRNRSENLSRALNSWVASSSIDEIVVVDWSSTLSTSEIIRQHKNAKFVHVYVNKQDYYCHTQASNLGARFASRDKLLFLDADILLQQDFFSKCPLSDGIFYAGNWRLAREQNETYLNGQFFINRADFFAVNGFDERIQSYGWDDSDLYRRLTAPRVALTINMPAWVFWKLSPVLGTVRKDIPPETLTHLPHHDSDRVAEYKKNETSVANQIMANRKLAIRRAPWSKKCNFREYDFVETSPGFFEADKLEDNFFAVKPLNGLGNRLRVLASCWAVAEVLGKKLYVCWSESSGFSAESFESLFSAKLDFISERSYRALERSPKNIVINNRVKVDTIYSDLESGGYRDLNFWTQGINKSNILLEWHNSLDHLSRGQLLQHPALREFDKLFVEKLRLLQPAEYVRKATQGFLEENFKQKNVIGVHIRRGDAMQCPWVSEYAVSSDHAFILKMEKELEQDSTVRFFVATDCPHTFEKIKERYPERILFYNKNFVESRFKASKANQADAFVEMLLLSKTTKIVGTRWSTFSEMASKIGNVELEVCQ